MLKMPDHNPSPDTDIASEAVAELASDVTQNIVRDIDMSLLSNRTALLTLFATCEEMILLAEKGEWQRVSQLESRRAKELVDFFAAPMQEAESVAAREAIVKLSALNDRLVEMATMARQDTAGKIKALRAGTEAQRQYNASR